MKRKQEWKVPTWDDLRKVRNDNKIAKYLDATPERWKLAIALALSIVKWKRGASRRGEGSCALCELFDFYGAGTNRPCRCCPLGKADKACSVSGSLWSEWNNECSGTESQSAAADALYNKLVELYRAEYERVTR